MLKIKIMKLRDYQINPVKNSIIKLHNIFGEMKNIKGVSKKWTKEKVLEVAKTCKNRLELSKKVTSGYSLLSDEELQNIFGDKDLTHLKNRKSKYTKNKLMELMKSVKNRSELPSRALSILKNKYPELLDEYLPIMTGKYERI